MNVAVAKIEEWRQVDDLPYEVSSEGRVRRGRRVLRPRVHSNGYLRVCLSVNGKHSDKYIHRLVANAFLGAADAGMHADHINGDRADNRLSNLRWLTPSANRSLRCLALGSQNGSSKYSEQLIRSIKSRFGKGVTDRLIADEFGVNRRFVNAVRNKRIWRHA
jgi:hypothetical protein